MELIDPTMDLPGFWRRVAGAGRPVLMLDYDGTLAPFKQERMEARPYPWVPSLLGAIMEAGTRVVIISGRKIDEVEELLGLDRGVEIWGSHGLERLDGQGRLLAHREPARVASALTEAEEWGLRQGLGDRVERKPGCVAVHLRGLPDHEAAGLEREASAFFRSLQEREPRLRTAPFDGGVELREGGCDKGTAVDTILKECPGETAAAFLGDDLTDEDGFRAIKGKGLGVLVREEPRETAASLRLVPPHELRWFLTRWLASTKEVA